MECLQAPENSLLTAWPPVAGASNMHEGFLQKRKTSPRLEKRAEEKTSVGESAIHTAEKAQRKGR